MRVETKKDTRARGRWAERVARDFLRARGLEPMHENYNFRGGEIDLIMRDGDTIVFVEVRYRNNSDFGNGAESITARKQKRVIATAMHYLQHTDDHAHPPCRFDVIAVSDDMHRYDVEWIPDAFDAG
ncbi:MAG TPA: YraN family protein [Gammaproteobacteria bacterium]|nr:YraN family protein [Gammaproteobacteria bacterium]